jgi:hypothetical protein
VNLSRLTCTLTCCKGTLPLCVVLIINDNPYGLIFSLSLYEVIAHKNCLKSMCWIQALDAMEIKIYVKYWHQEYKRRIRYDQEEEMKIEFLCRTEVIHALSYVLSQRISGS